MEQKWVIYVDDLSTRKNGGVRIVLVTPEGEELSGALRLEFRTTNNEAEYKAVIAGLGTASNWELYPWKFGATLKSLWVISGENLRQKRKR
jgi:ribonuclease HI